MLLGIVNEYIRFKDDMNCQVVLDGVKIEVVEEAKYSQTSIIRSRLIRIPALSALFDRSLERFHKSPM